MLNSLFLAITGPSGSGKSTLARALADELLQLPTVPSVAVIQEDAYYRDQSALSFSDRLKTNYDHPSALEHSLLEQHLGQLRQGQSIAIPLYDYVQHTRTAQHTLQTPATVVIVEGILLFSSASLMRHFDLRIFLDTPLEQCLQRRITRDQRERGRTRQSVEEQFANSVLPMAREYRALWQQQADVQLTGNHAAQLALAAILRKLEQLT
jgi:uridine kinase